MVLPLPHPMSEGSWNGKEWLGFTLVASVVSQGVKKEQRQSGVQRESCCSVYEGMSSQKKEKKIKVLSVWERSAASSSLSHPSLRILNGDEKISQVTELEQNVLWATWATL